MWDRDAFAREAADRVCARYAAEWREVLGTPLRQRTEADRAADRKRASQPKRKAQIREYGKRWEAANREARRVYWQERWRRQKEARAALAAKAGDELMARCMENAKAERAYQKRVYRSKKRRQAQQYQEAAE